MTDLFCVCVCVSEGDGGGGGVVGNNQSLNSAMQVMVFFCVMHQLFVPSHQC
jgi:hypothetical protein